jgi:predicted transcriptional regulator
MLDSLPPRERQIVNILYLKGEATVADVCGALPDPLSASAVRAMLTRLVGKGAVSRRETERGLLYAPALSEAKAKQSALGQVVKVFFGGSTAGAASALLGMSDKIDDAELDELERLIAEARKGQRK